MELHLNFSHIINSGSSKLCNELPQGKPQTSTGRLTAAHATRLGYLNSRFAVMTTTSSNTTVCTHLVYLVASHILESHFHS